MAVSNITTPHPQQIRMSDPSTKTHLSDGSAFQKHLTHTSSTERVKDIPHSETRVQALSELHKHNSIRSLPDSHSSTNDKKTGTNLALEKSNAELKKVAEDFEQQIYALMWRRVFTAANTKEQGCSALDMLGPELMDQMVKSGMNKDSMGNLAQRIYEDLIRARDGHMLNSKTAG